jgi:UPF0755 protein
MKKIGCITSVVSLGLLIAGGVCAVSFYRDYSGGGAGAPRVFIVEAGDSTNAIASKLRDEGHIKHPAFFTFMTKQNGNDGAYREGVYEISPGMGYDRLMQILKGEITTNALTRVTVPEGFEYRQIVDRLEKEGLIDRQKFLDASKTALYEYDFLKEITKKRENELEGYLFPDTYFIPKGADEKRIIDMFLKRFGEVFNAELRQRARETGFSIDGAVTLASVIEREAVGDEDRDRVSSVFHNRLKSKDYPYLQSCATVEYLLKERKAVLSDADTRIQSPYNTYINPGLPVGPIASPGEASLRAALYPAGTEYLFFVLGKDGKHIFSRTYEEHLAAQK